MIFAGLVVISLACVLLLFVQKIRTMALLRHFREKGNPMPTREEWRASIEFVVYHELGYALKIIRLPVLAILAAVIGQIIASVF